MYVALPIIKNVPQTTLQKSGGSTVNPVQVVSGLVVFTPSPNPESYLPTNTIVPTFTPQATYTPYPTYTAFVPWSFTTATVTKVPFEPSQINWVFSYYDPSRVREDFKEFGYAVNCHTDNLIYDDMGNPVECRDTTASGLPWSKYRMYFSTDVRFAGGLAVPYYPGTYDPIYPMGSVVSVTSPSIIAGDYIVIDICPACDDYVAEKGVLFLDFLAKGLPEGVTFWDKVTVVGVRYPWEVLSGPVVTGTPIYESEESQ